MCLLNKEKYFAMDKKIYMTPTASAVEFEFSAVMSNSLLTGGDGGSGEFGYDDDQATQGQVGSWSDIWNNM